MKRPSTYIGITLLALILIAVGVYALQHPKTLNDSVVSTATYLCRDGKSMDAVFTDQDVTLTLSDTRAFILPHVVSDSGVRYEKDTVAFVGKGNNAFLLENDVQTYVDCVITGSPTGTKDGAKQFADSAGTFSFTYPETVTVSGGGVGYTQGWMVNASTSGLLLAKATLSEAFEPNTNFSDATLTIGTSADPSAVSTCLTHNPTGGPAAPATQETINGTTYTVFKSSDAGAGNLYQTTSYRVLRNSQCYVIEYTIHSTNINNYPDDQDVEEFDRAGVESAMEGIVESFRFSDGA